MLAAEDIEAGRQKKKLQTEPTLPIYLKVNICTNINTYIRVKKKKTIFLFSFISKTEVVNPISKKRRVTYTRRALLS